MTAAMPDLRDFARTETRRNGLVITIRALRADDRARMAQAIRRLDGGTVHVALALNGASP